MTASQIVANASEEDLLAKKREYLRKKKDSSFDVHHLRERAAGAKKSAGSNLLDASKSEEEPLTSTRFTQNANAKSQSFQRRTKKLALKKVCLINECKRKEHDYDKKKASDRRKLLDYMAATRAKLPMPEFPEKFRDAQAYGRKCSELPATYWESLGEWCVHDNQKRRMVVRSQNNLDDFPTDDSHKPARARREKESSRGSPTVLERLADEGNRARSCCDVPPNGQQY